MAANMCGVRVARVAAERSLDVALAVFEILKLYLGESQYRAEPPIITVSRGEWLEHRKLFNLPAGLARKANEPEHTGTACSVPGSNNRDQPRSFCTEVMAGRASAFCDFIRNGVCVRENEVVERRQRRLKRAAVSDTIEPSFLMKVRCPLEDYQSQYRVRLRP